MVNDEEKETYKIMLLWIFVVRRKEKPSDEEILELVDLISKYNIMPDASRITSEKEEEELQRIIQNVIEEKNNKGIYT
jgi:hypothetical protein